jgi:hypothetical protein
MHKGRIAETGNHHALMSQRGLYWRLHQIQFGLQSQMEEDSEHLQNINSSTSAGNNAAGHFLQPVS